MASLPEQQGAEIAPPRRGSVLAIDVDSTARAYDITGLALGASAAPEAAISAPKTVVLWMQADTNDVYFYFHSATASDLSDTAKVTAGSTAAFATTHCALIEAGGPPLRFRISRAVDKFLVVKAASTSGILRVWAGSSESP